MLPASDAAGSAGPLRWLERALMVFGAGCLLIYAAYAAHSAIYQRQAKAELDRIVAGRNASTSQPVPAAPAAAPESPTMSRRVPVVPNVAHLARGSMIGRVDVPRLKLSAAIAEGDDDSTLGKAVGHLPDTPLPWEKTGNAAFAAHRDGLFRPLRNIRVNDEVRVVTPRGEFLYRVKKTQVVDPDDVWVLAPTRDATLTLITCYPFSFVGHAPQRFIVQAERVIPELSGTPFKGTVIR